MGVPVKIRAAKPHDASNLMRLLQEGLISEQPEGVYPAPEALALLDWVTSVLLNGYIIVTEKSGRIVGSIGLRPVQLPWSQEWLLNMEWFYIHKSFRGGAADALLMAAHAFADDKGVRVLGGVSSARDTTLKDRLMKMKGYIYVGGQFIRRPGNG